MTNLTLCLLLHLFGKSTILCRCPLNREQHESEYPPTNVTVNYITQNGRANIAGDGTIEYKNMQEKLSRIERLEVENKRLSEMVQMLVNRDKYAAKRRQK
jgi:hypothetical protein